MDPITFLSKGTLPLINAVITRLDKEAWDLLKPYENKIVCFQIEGFPTLYFEIHQDGLHVVDSQLLHPDVTFSGPFSAFVGMVFTKNRLQHGLHVKGDMDCAKALYDTWRYLDLDWEGYFAQFIGGDLVNIASKSLKQWQSWTKETFNHRIKDLGNYLQDETQYLPTQQEVEHFLKEVDTLRLDVDRFEARLALLQARSQSS